MNFQGLIYIIGIPAIIVAVMWGWTRWGAGGSASDDDE